MKAKILTTINIKDQWLDEIINYMPGIEFEIHMTKEKLQTWYNPMQNSANGVFHHLRQLVNAPTGYRYRVYVMSQKEGKAMGITSHLAMYDHLDRDGVLDFYICLPARKQKKTTLNGFKYEFARIFIHECLHGKEQEIGDHPFLYRDRTHDWEKEGRLKELIAEHFKLKELKVKLSLWQQILKLVGIRDALVKKKS